MSGAGPLPASQIFQNTMPQRTPYAAIAPSTRSKRSTATPSAAEGSTDVPDATRQKVTAVSHCVNGHVTRAACTASEQPRLSALDPQQEALLVHASRVAAEAAPGADDAMAGDDDRNRVGS